MPASGWKAPRRVEILAPAPLGLRRSARVTDDGHTGIRRALTAGSIAFAVYSTPKQELDTNLLLRFYTPDLVAAKTAQPQA